MALLRFLRRLKRPSLVIRQVRGNSMLPAYKPGHIVVAWHTQRLRAGDVVIVRHEGREKMKRVSRLDGSRLYVLGDNLAASTDSRDFGWLSRQDVVGRIIWPNSSFLTPESS